MFVPACSETPRSTAENETLIDDMHLANITVQADQKKEVYNNFAIILIGVKTPRAPHSSDRFSLMPWHETGGRSTAHSSAQSRRDKPAKITKHRAVDTEENVLPVTQRSLGSFISHTTGQLFLHAAYFQATSLTI